MKCISLWQPWATLIAIGAKHYETRSWFTPHRGPLAIHAAKKKDPYGLEACTKDPRFAAALAAAGITSPDALPFGSILCVVDLVNVYRVTKDGLLAPGGMSVRGMPSSIEQAFGDYAVGRYAWLLQNVRRLPSPIDFKGAQQLFDIPDALVAEVAGA